MAKSLREGFMAQIDEVKDEIAPALAEIRLPIEDYQQAERDTL